MQKQACTSRILIIDQEENIYNNYSHLLDSIGEIFFNIETFFSVDEAFQYLTSNKVDIVLLDAALITRYNRYMLDIIREDNPEINIITVGSLSDKLDVNDGQEYYDQSQGMFNLLIKIKNALSFNKN